MEKGISRLSSEPTTTVGLDRRLIASKSRSTPRPRAQERRASRATTPTATRPVAILLLSWLVVMVTSAGEPSPLPYLPLLNPLELMQLLILLLLSSWLLLHRRRSVRILGEVNPKVIMFLLGGMAFLLLNEVIAHTIHHWYDVPYRMEALHRSLLFQATVSVVWSVSALIITVMATRLEQRSLWIAGASLLALVVVKLFFVDLAGTGTIARIVSFIAVGLLMLLIGYFSPMPPKREEVEA